MKKTFFFLGIFVMLLGTLWLLQGLGIVVMQPVLCFANCDYVQGPSALWAAIGVSSLVAGLVAIFFSFTRRP